MNQLVKFIRPLTLTALISVASSMSAQMMVLRPDRVPDRPPVAPTDLAKASAKAKEVSVRQAGRIATQQPRRTKPKVKAPSAVAMSLPPLEFVAEENMEDNTPRLDLSTFTGGRPSSLADDLRQASISPAKIGHMTVGIPDCLTIFESGPDFLIGSISNMLDMEVWELDSSYMLSTPQAYIKYLGRLYGGIEEQTTSGNRTDISGYDVNSYRNYRVRLITQGDKLYVARLIYLPAMERAVTEILLPQLLTSPLSAL